jgi:hypothetical protein
MNFTGGKENCIILIKSVVLGVTTPVVFANMKKIISVLSIFTLLLASLPLAAQEEFIEPPAKRLTRIPFTQLTGGIVIIQATLNDFPDTLNFILDTGSSGISLDSTTADYLKLNPVATERTIRGIAGIRKVSFLYKQKLHFPGLTVENLDFHINDYAILTSVYGERIDGIIGYSLLSRYILEINYDSLKINILSRGTIRYPRGGYLLKPTLSTLPAQTARIKDEKTVNSRFLYDMGAGVCVMFSRDFIQDSNFLNKKRKLLSKEGEGVGGKIDMFISVIKELKIGPYKFRSVPVYIFDDVYNVTSYPYLGGLIGNDILRRFNVILNYGKRDIYLTPNSHFDDPFDYAYAGIELYLIDGYILVGDVAKESPAEAAGLREGDIVVAVNNNFSQNLNQFKIALQAPNEKMKIIVRRDGQLKEIQFKVKSIL